MTVKNSKDKSCFWYIISLLQSSCRKIGTPDFPKICELLRLISQWNLSNFFSADYCAGGDNSNVLKTPVKKGNKSKRSNVDSSDDVHGTPSKRRLHDDSENSDNGSQIDNFIPKDVKSESGLNDTSEAEISDLEEKHLDLVLYLIKAANGLSYIAAVLVTAVKRLPEEASLKNQLFDLAKIQLPSYKASSSDNKPTDLLSEKLFLVFGCVTQDTNPSKDYMVSIKQPHAVYSERFLAKLSEKQPNFMTIKKSAIQKGIFNTAALRDEYKEKFQTFFHGNVTLVFKVAK